MQSRHVNYNNLGMSIITNDNSLAWTLSDNTSGSSKMKRGGAGKPKVAPSSQDLLTNNISKYLSESAKMENDRDARQLAVQEQQLILEERRIALQERQYDMEQKKMEHQYQGQGQGYGQGLNHQHYDQYGYERQRHDRQRPDHQYYNSSRRLEADLHRSGYDRLSECLARGGDYYEICDILSMSHSGQGSSSKFKSPRIDESFDSSHQSATINLTGSKGGYVISCLNDECYIFSSNVYLYI